MPLSRSLLALTFAFVTSCAARPPTPPTPPVIARNDLDASADLDASTNPTDPSTSREEAWQALCTEAVTRTPSLERAALTYPPEARCDDPFCDTVDHAPRGADRCYVANDNIARAENQILASVATAPPVRNTWDRTTPPRGFDRVDAHLHFSPRELELLQANGFVALGRARYDSYALAYHEVFRQQLPVFVSVDSILHAIFSAHGAMLLNIERDRLVPTLHRVLTRLRAELGRSRARLSPDTVRDLDVYLSVAVRLLVPYDESPPLLAEDEAAVGEALSLVQAETLTATTLFGRERMIDGSQFAPRGHYLGGEPVELPGLRSTELSSYFRAVMWLSRVEFNLVSRDCRSSQPGETPNPAETPREALDALALAELAERAGVFADLALFERVYEVFAGRREDVSLPTLAALGRSARIHSTDPNAFDALRAAVGGGYVRTARTHFTPEGTVRLPVIATMFGPRIVPDVAALEGLVHDRVPERMHLGFADVGYTLGHDRARHYLADDLQHHPALGAQLEAARTAVHDGTRGGNDLYRRWLAAVLALGETPRGTVPAFMRSTAWEDFRLNSALVGFAQIRHNYVLLAGQGYDAYGCEIPDGYVEPAVEVYDALIEFVRAAQALDRGQASYLARVMRVLRTLRTIAATEREGRPLSEAQRRWLGMVAEHTSAGGYSGDSGEPPKWTGWYFDLFPDREIGAEKAADFVADYFTLTNAGEVRYLGAETPRMAAFVVDTGGAPRMMVGPVARGYELASPIGGRLDDESARTAPGHSAPWRASYMPEDDRPVMRFGPVGCAGEQIRYGLETSITRGEAEVTALDHHGDRLSETARRALDGTVAPFTFAPTDPNGIEEFHVRIRDDAGRRFDWVVPSSGNIEEE